MAAPDVKSHNFKSGAKDDARKASIAQASNDEPSTPTPTPTPTTGGSQLKPLAQVREVVTGNV